MPLILKVTQSPESAMCCAALAWAASASSSNGGEKSAAKWTANHTRSRMVQARPVERKRAGATSVCTGSTMGRDMTEPAEYQPEQTTPSVDAPPVLEHLRAVAAEMLEQLDACRKHGDAPKVEAVHHLRTGTRRVEATLETLAREAGARGLGKDTEEARQRWLRPLKKVRRASGTARDLDVHRELLADNFLPAEEEAKADESAADAAPESPAVASPREVTP